MSTTEPTAEVVHIAPGTLATRVPPSELANQAAEIREMMRAVLVDGTDYGMIRGTQRPSLFKSGAEWLLKWARFGHRLEPIEVDRDGEGRKYGVTYRCTVTLLDNPEAIVATCDGYCGYDEPDREAHKSKYGKDIPRSPWNTILKMAQKRALVGATLQATATSGLFTQDVEDHGPVADTPPGPRTEGWQSAAEEAEAHRKLSERIRALPQDSPARAAAKATTEEHGWPLSLERFKALAEIVDNATPPSEPESSSGASPPTPEAADATTAPTEGSGGESRARCHWCGTDMPLGEAVMDDGDPFHQRCLEEMRREKAEAERFAATGGEPF